MLVVSLSGINCELFVVYERIPTFFSRQGLASGWT